MRSMVRGRRATRVRLLSVLAAAAVLVAACGGDDGDDATTTTTGGGPGSVASTTAPGEEEPDFDPDGVLRISQSVSASNQSFDPTKAGPGNNNYLFAMYGTLLTKTSFDSYEPNLATKVEIVDPQTIEVELREGMVFTDDTPVNAEALKFNLERFAQNPNRLGLRSEFTSTLDNVEVTGDLTATVHLKAPTSGIFYDLFAGPETILVSPTAMQSGTVDFQKTGVGAGPFVLESWQPDVKMVFKKNPKYWDADNVKLAGVEFIQLTAGPPIINGLRAGEVDIAATDANSAKSLVDPIVATSFKHPGVFILNVCKRNAPLSDLKVRQAMSLAMDRVAIGQALYDGNTEPVYSLQRKDDPRYDPELEGITDRDVAKAKQLMTEAGYPDGFDTSMIVAPGLTTVAGELLQQQWKEIGINVSLQATPNVVQDFYLDGKAPLFPVGQTRAGIDAFSVLMLPGSFAAVCGYNDPVAAQAVRDVMALPPDSDEVVAAWHALGTVIQDTLPFIPIVFHNQVVAANEDRVGGLEWQLDEFGNAIARLDHLYIKA